MSILTTDAQSITHLTTPFRGRPTTRTYTNRKDEPEIAVEARALTPLRARLTHYAALLAATSMALVLHGHDKTEKEKDRHALLDRKHPPRWCSLPRHKYYGNSFHVVLECFGERHDILTVYGLKKATAIHARLKACDAVMDGIGFSDSGVALTPGSDWNVDAGGL